MFSLAASRSDEKQGVAGAAGLIDEPERLFKGVISIPAEQIDMQFYCTNTKVSEQH